MLLYTMSSAVLNTARQFSDSAALHTSYRIRHGVLQAANLEKTNSVFMSSDFLLQPVSQLKDSV
jgi:hypothetical protein